MAIIKITKGNMLEAIMARHNTVSEYDRKKDIQEPKDTQRVIQIINPEKVTRKMKVTMGMDMVKSKMISSPNTFHNSQIIKQQKTNYLQ